MYIILDLNQTKKLKSFQKIFCGIGGGGPPFYKGTIFLASSIFGIYKWFVMTLGLHALVMIPPTKRIYEIPVKTMMVQLFVESSHPCILVPDDSYSMGCY